MILKQRNLGKMSMAVLVAGLMGSSAAFAGTTAPSDRDAVAQAEQLLDVGSDVPATASSFVMDWPDVGRVEMRAWLVRPEDDSVGQGRIEARGRVLDESGEIETIFNLSTWAPYAPSDFIDLNGLVVMEDEGHALLAESVDHEDGGLSLWLTELSDLRTVEVHVPEVVANASGVEWTILEAAAIHHGIILASSHCNPSFDQCVATARLTCGAGNVASVSYICTDDGFVECSFTCKP